LVSRRLEDGEGTAFPEDRSKKDREDEQRKHKKEIADLKGEINEKKMKQDQLAIAAAKTTALGALLRFFAIVSVVGASTVPVVERYDLRIYQDSDREKLTKDTRRSSKQYRVPGMARESLEGKLQGEISHRGCADDRKKSKFGNCLRSSGKAVPSPSSRHTLTNMDSPDRLVWVLVSLQGWNRV
jgi:hypothetical protein